MSSLETLLELSADSDRSELMNELLIVTKLLTGIMKKHGLDTSGDGSYHSFQCEMHSSLSQALTSLHRVLGRVVAENKSADSIEKTVEKPQ